MRILGCDVCKNNRREMSEYEASLAGWKVEGQFVTCIDCRLKKLEEEK